MGSVSETKSITENDKKETPKHASLFGDTDSSDDNNDETLPTEPPVAKPTSGDTFVVRSKTVDLFGSDEEDDDDTNVDSPVVMGSMKTTNLFGSDDDDEDDSNTALSGIKKFNFFNDSDDDS